MHWPVLAGWTASVALVAWAAFTGCAPPKEVDYDKPDASPDPDAPRPIAVAPREGKEDVNQLSVLRITFDKHLDDKTLTQGRVSLNSGGTGRWLVSYYDPLRRQVVAWPSGAMLRQTTWVLTLSRGLDGLNGSPVYPGRVTWFRTGDDSALETPFKVRSFEDEVKPILDAHCVSCHAGGQAAAGLKLDTVDNITKTALNEPAIGWQDWNRIEPTRPGQSYILFKLIDDGTAPGKTMPREMGSVQPEKLTFGEKETIMDWIAGGASFF